MQPQPLTREEAKALLAACPHTTCGIRDKAFLAFLYRGGSRITAALTIRPADIDWERNTVVIHKDKGGRGRTIVLDDGVLEIMKTWACVRDSLGINGIHPFFCCVKKKSLGNPIDTSHYRRLLMRLREIVGIEKRCHPHGLRHTAASELLDEGFDLATIQAQLGHKHISTTSIYIHRLRPDLANAKLKDRAW